MSSVGLTQRAAVREIAASLVYPKGPAAYTGRVRHSASAFALAWRLTCAVVAVVALCGQDWLTAADAACAARVKLMVARFLSSSEPAGDNELFALLSQCADTITLRALLEALAKPVGVRQPLEIAGAVQAAMASPGLNHDVAATQLLAARLDAIPDSAARTSLTYLLGPRDAAPALNRILSADSAPAVRAAAAIALRNCKTPPDFAALWRAAKTDPEGRVRAQAYQTLDRFGQLRTADEFLAASRAQTDASSNGRLLAKWLQAEKSDDQQIAETLTRLAGHTGTGEASGALAEIVTVLQRPPQPALVMVPAPPSWPPPARPSLAARSASIAAMPLPPPPALQETQLQRALYERRAAISTAALAQFAAGKDLPEDAARIAIECALAVNRCGPGGCERLGEILAVTDRMAPALALEASHDILSGTASSYFAHRRRQYRVLFLAALLAVVLLVAGGFAWQRARMFAMGTGWLLIVLPAALLQFTFGPVGGVSAWPPPRLWPATALGSVAVTLLVAVTGTLALRRRWLIAGGLIAGEAAWWLVPGLLYMGGIRLAMQHYSQEENWLPLMLALFMIAGAPLMTLAISGAAWRMQRFFSPRELQ